MNYSPYHRIALNMQLIWSNTLSRALYICARRSFHRFLSHFPIDVSCKLSDFNEFHENIINVTTSRPTLSFCSYHHVDCSLFNTTFDAEAEVDKQ